MEKEDCTIWTIGHSTRPLAEFFEMLDSFHIELVADIRSFPGSRRFPQYNKEALAGSLPAHGIAYLHLKDLGGRRKAKSDSYNTTWKHPAFRGYADYMQTEAFKAGIAALQEMAKLRPVAIMCSEAVWWRCHRSMVSDYLKSLGWLVMHILAPRKAEEHPYTAPAKIVNGELSYQVQDS